MPKIDRTIKFDPEDLAEIERMNIESKGYITITHVVRTGTKAEIERLQKIYPRKEEKK
jgi:uncharacterized protein YjcR